MAHMTWILCSLGYISPHPVADSVFLPCLLHFFQSSSWHSSFFLFFGLTSPCFFQRIVNWAYPNGGFLKRRKPQNHWFMKNSNSHKWSSFGWWDSGARKHWSPLRWVATFNRPRRERARAEIDQKWKAFNENHIYKWENFQAVVDDTRG